MMNKPCVFIMSLIGGFTYSYPLITSNIDLSFHKNEHSDAYQGQGHASGKKKPMEDISGLIDDMILMSGDEISAKLSGNIIAPDFTVTQTVLDFSEQFLSDGSWISIRNMRGPVQIEGRWFIQEDKLCVEQTIGGVKCRNVWRSRSTDKLYISDLGASPQHSAMVMVVVK